MQDWNWGNGLWTVAGGGVFPGREIKAVVVQDGKKTVRVMWRSNALLKRRFSTYFFVGCAALMPTTLRAFDDSSRSEFEIPVSEPFRSVKVEELIINIHFNLNGTIVATVNKSSCTTNECPLQFTLFSTHLHRAFSVDLEDIGGHSKIYTEVFRCNPRVKAHHFANLHGGNDSYELDCVDGQKIISPTRSGIKIQATRQDHK